jgi:hypothetical protein
MAILDNINLDFQVLNTGEPNCIIVMDTSVWGAIEDKNAIIKIVIPGSSKVREFNFVKNKTNIFNSSNLLITPVGEYKDLADGIYKIDIVGAHGHCKHRDYLKTDKIRLLIGDMYLEDFYFCKDIRNNELKTLRDIKLSLDAAELLTAKGNIKEAVLELNNVYDRVRNYIKCRK